MLLTVCQKNPADVSPDGDTGNKEMIRLGQDKGGCGVYVGCGELARFASGRSSGGVDCAASDYGYKHGAAILPRLN